MVVRYKHGSEYVCDYLHKQQGAPVCQVLRAAGIDARVAAAFLDAVTPAEMDAWSEARRVECQADTALRRAEAQQVERLRYQASLAERQFNRVDPDNRLVAAELERRWEAALVELRHAENALAQRDQEDVRRAESRVLDPVLRAQALALGQRLPALWADPGVSREHRKALLRCLIDKVILRRVARDAASVRVVWRGGAVSELTVALPVNSFAALPRGAEMQARVLELARAGMHDEEIAQVLTTEGHRSPGPDEGVLPATARTIRLRHGIKVVQRCTRWPRVLGWLTVADVALQLQVPQRWLRERLWAGAIQTTREPSGRYLLPDRPDTLDALRQLRAGTIRHVDLTKSP